VPRASLVAILLLAAASAQDLITRTMALQPQSPDFLRLGGSPG